MTSWKSQKRIVQCSFLVILLGFVSACGLDLERSADTVQTLSPSSRSALAKQPTAAQLPSLTPIPVQKSPSSTPLPPTPTLANYPTSEGQPSLPPTWTPKPTPLSRSTDIPPPTVSLSTCNKPGTIAFEDFNSQIAGEQLEYRIYLPPCYDQARLYPVLYIFHGSAQSDSHWDELGIDEAADELILSGQIPKLIIIMPNGGDIAQDSSGGPQSFESLVINELIPDVESKYCAWPESKARAVGGLSRGGYWALEIAFRNPELFSSIGSHSGALLDEAAGTALDPLISVATADLTDLRIYIDVGQNDYTLPQLRELHETLNGLAKEHQWILNQGSHQDAYWSAHIEDYLRWYTSPWPPTDALYPDCSLTFSDR